jgi:hypothetical protein
MRSRLLMALLFGGLAFSPDAPAAPVERAAGAAPGQGAGASNQEINDRFVREIAGRIVGRELEPAGNVFKNMRIEWLKTTPARQLLDIMNGGYARALGVRCTHCHLEHDFSSDDKRPKRAAREMAMMHWTINQTLRKMKDLSSEPDERPINCATCHRGAANPRDAQR